MELINSVNNNGIKLPFFEFDLSFISFTIAIVTIITSSQQQQQHQLQPWKISENTCVKCASSVCVDGMRKGSFIYSLCYTQYFVFMDRNCNTYIHLFIRHYPLLYSCFSKNRNTELSICVQFVFYLLLS